MGGQRRRIRDCPSASPCRGSPLWLPIRFERGHVVAPGRRLEHVPVLLRRFKTLRSRSPLWPISSRFERGHVVAPGTAPGTCPRSAPACSNSGISEPSVADLPTTEKTSAGSIAAPGACWLYAASLTRGCASCVVPPDHGKSMPEVIPAGYTYANSLTGQASCP